jgi:hypothetical protein
MRERGLEKPDIPQQVEDDVEEGEVGDLEPLGGSQRSERRARGVLAELESCLATHDLDEMVDFFTEDVVLVGDADALLHRRRLDRVSRCSGTVAR